MDILSSSSLHSVLFVSFAGVFEKERNQMQIQPRYFESGGVYADVGGLLPSAGVALLRFLRIRPSNN